MVSSLELCPPSIPWPHHYSSFQVAGKLIMTHQAPDNSSARRNPQGEHSCHANKGVFLPTSAHSILRYPWLSNHQFGMRTPEIGPLEVGSRERQKRKSVEVTGKGQRLQLLSWSGLDIRSSGNWSVGEPCQYLFMFVCKMRFRWQTSLGELSILTFLIDS